MMEVMGKLPHLLPMAIMVEVGVIKIPITEAEGVGLGEGVDEVVVVVTGVDEVGVVAVEVVVVLEGVVEGEEVEEGAEGW